MRKFVLSCLLALALTSSAVSLACRHQSETHVSISPRQRYLVSAFNHSWQLTSSSLQLAHPGGNCAGMPGCDSTQSSDSTSKSTAVLSAPTSALILGLLICSLLLLTMASIWAMIHAPSVSASVLRLIEIVFSSLLSIVKPAQAAKRRLDKRKRDIR